MKIASLKQRFPFPVNLVKLVNKGGKTYFPNPSSLEMKNIASPGTLVYNAGNCRFTCKFIEMFLQIIIFICTTTEEISRHLQFTPGNKRLKSAPPLQGGNALHHISND